MFGCSFREAGRPRGTRHIGDGNRGSCSPSLRALNELPCPMPLRHAHASLTCSFRTNWRACATKRAPRVEKSSLTASSEQGAWYFTVELPAAVGSADRPCGPRCAAFLALLGCKQMRLLCPFCLCGSLLMHVFFPESGGTLKLPIQAFVKPSFRQATAAACLLPFAGPTSTKGPWGAEYHRKQIERKNISSCSGR